MIFYILLHMSSPIAKPVECSRAEIVKQTRNQSQIFAIFVEYSGEKNMVDVIIFNSIPLSVRIESQMKFAETSFHRLLLFF